jgi:hypothetical protein
MSKKTYIKKELMSWGPTTCTCGHSYGAHRSRCVGLSGNNLDRDCRCKEYRPKDNLIFLEKKYEEMLNRERRKDKSK